MWPFTSKRRIEEIEDHLEKIETSLRASFYHIKHDISHTKNYNNHHINHILKRLDRLESQFFNLQAENQEKDQQGEATQDEFEEPAEIKLIPKQTPLVEQKSIADSLTDVQQQMLIRLAQLHVEAPDQWVSSKRLAEELYPEKQYEKVRPMISTYLDVLEEFNLVRKERKRKQVFIKLTQKGISHINPKLKIKTGKKISIKNKKRLR